MTAQPKASTEQDSAPRRPPVAVAELMREALSAAPSRRFLGECLNVAPSHITRACDGLVGIGVSVCLRLAEVLGRDPTEILRACGHGELSDWIEQWRTAPACRSPLHEALDRLHAADRLIVGRLIDRLLVADGIAPNQERDIRPAIQARPRAFRSLMSLVVGVQGAHDDITLTALQGVEKAVPRFRKHGLFLGAAAAESNGPLQKVVDRLAVDLFDERAAAEEGNDDGRTDLEKRRDRVHAMMRRRIQAGYYLGLVVGWRLSQRFGGRR